MIKLSLLLLIALVTPRGVLAQCAISSVALSSVGSCDDNGTPTSTDDFFTANVEVTFANPPSTGSLRIEPAGDLVAGGGATSVAVGSLVGTTHTFTGVRFKADGTPTVIEVEFTDQTSCVRTAQGSSVAECSDSCSVSSVALSSVGSCDGNGTADTTDDFFAADVNVTFAFPPTTGSLRIEPPGDLVAGGGATSVAVGLLTGNTHTFTGVRFKADGTATVIEVEFTDDMSCVRTGADSSVAECSSVPATATAAPIATATATSTATATAVPQGGACTDAVQCATGFCADDICCDTVCAGDGQSCTVPGQEGTCVTAPASAPAASHAGLVAMLAALIVAALVALRMRQHV